MPDPTVPEIFGYHPLTLMYKHTKEEGSAPEHMPRIVLAAIAYADKGDPTPDGAVGVFIVAGTRAIEAMRGDGVDELAEAAFQARALLTSFPDVVALAFGTDATAMALAMMRAERAMKAGDKTPDGTSLN